jgi:hypothetical protein
VYQACGIVHLYTCIFWRVKLETSSVEEVNTFLVEHDTEDGVRAKPPYRFFV